MSRDTYSELAYNYIKQQIMDNHYSPGTSLNESEIAETLHMSRTPVRSALKQLDEEGLIQVKPYKGAVVNTLKLNMIGFVERIDFVRHSFLTMIDYIERKIIKIKYEKLQQIMDDLSKAYAKGDIEQSLIYENQFYKTLLSLAPNHYFKNIAVRAISDLENFAILEAQHNLFSYDYILGVEVEYFPLILDNLAQGNYIKVRDLINKLADKIILDRLMNHSKIQAENID